MTNPYLPYAGIGSRRTPHDVLDDMLQIGLALASHGFTLRSGGAAGADYAFEQGVVTSHNYTAKEIYLPWKGFNGSDSHLYAWPDPDTKHRARAIAAANHPAWNRCTQGARKLHTRNVAQLLGYDLDQPSLFVVCWTEGALGGGGTGQALRIAKGLGIPIFDLGVRDKQAKLDQLSEFASSLIPSLVSS